VRDSFPDYSVTEVAKELGRRWELCTDKQRYETVAARDQLRYRQVEQ